MHELGMCEGVLAAVQERAGGREVARVGVRAGTLLRVEPDAFQASFEMVAAGTSAAGAVTEVTTTPLQASCTECERDFETHDPFPACPDCGGLRLQREGGEELVLAWIEYGDEEAARTEAVSPSTPDADHEPTGS